MQLRRNRSRAKAGLRTIDAEALGRVCGGTTLYDPTTSAEFGAHGGGYVHIGGGYWVDEVTMASALYEAGYL